MVEQGQSVPVDVEIKGRPQRSVVLQTRPEGRGDIAWTSVPLQSGPGPKLKATLDKVKQPLAYRLTTASTTSSTYVVRVRYPLAIKSFEVVLAPPAYTGMKTETVKGAISPRSREPWPRSGSRSMRLWNQPRWFSPTTSRSRRGSPSLRLA